MDALLLFHSFQELDVPSGMELDFNIQSHHFIQKYS